MYTLGQCFTERSGVAERKGVRRHHTTFSRRLAKCRFCASYVGRTVLLSVLVKEMKIGRYWRKLRRKLGGLLFGPSCM